MSGHTPWSKIKRKCSRPSESPTLDHWLNLAADIEVNEEVADQFVDELMDRLPGASVSSEPIGTLRRLEITIESTIGRDEFVTVIGETAQHVGADLVRARIFDEYAWQH